MRRMLVGTNLKMNLTASELTVYLRALRTGVAAVSHCALFVLPSFPSLWVARRELEGSNVRWGAQDLHPADGGAHTGDVSASMLVDLGCTYVQVGHVERRREHGESDALIAAKVAQALRHGLTPILCVGEPARGSTESALDAVIDQLGIAIGELGSDADRTIVAYEPAWAIGSGAEAAPAEHVLAVHAGIHRWLVEVGLVDVPVIYGGSLDESTAAGLVALPGVDGLYVGRAALDPGRLATIAAIAEGAALERASA
jgi:triosephosphate isomerase